MSHVQSAQHFCYLSRRINCRTLTCMLETTVWTACQLCTNALCFSDSCFNMTKPTCRQLYRAQPWPHPTPLGWTETVETVSQASALDLTDPLVSEWEQTTAAQHNWRDFDSSTLMLMVLWWNVRCAGVISFWPCTLPNFLSKWRSKFIHTATSNHTVQTKSVSLSFFPQISDGVCRLSFITHSSIFQRHSHTFITGWDLVREDLPPRLFLSIILTN